MRYMLQYPDLHGSSGDLLDAGDPGELARVAERAGFDGFALTEHPAPSISWLDRGGHQSLDPFVALSYVAATTIRLRLLTYLAVLPYRNPALLAKTAATVDRLSGGRFVLGAGTGYLKSEYRALGVDFDERNALFDEALDVLPRHWSGQPFDYTGRHFSCRDTIGLPAAAQQPIPIWIGGNSTLTLRRVAARAQGWMPLAGPAAIFSTVRSPAVSTDDEFTGRLGMLRDLAGERFAELDIVMPYTDESITGRSDVERHRDQLGRLGAAGATWIVARGPVGPAPEAAEFAEWFGETFIGRTA